MRLAACVFLLAASCGGGGGSIDEDGLHFSGLRMGTYLRGVQTSQLVVDSGLGVTSARLFLDDLPIAASRTAPFHMTWDTAVFRDGEHRLRAYAELGDGSAATGELDIRIDNTEPVVDTRARNVLPDQLLEIAASDNAGVARVEVSDGVGAPHILTEPPYRMPWTRGCGSFDLVVRVVDLAGGETTGTMRVTAAHRGDVDCDGYLAPAAGGSDCDDADARTHPDASEYPEGIDRNCDGVAGTLEGIDLDHDGVPSAASGGDDCDDADPQIHGQFLVLERRALVAGDAPLRWLPGEAAFAAGGPSPQIALNRSGVILLATTSAPGRVELTRIASGANPGSIAASFDHIVFGRGNDVVILRRDGGWVEHRVIHADAPVGRVAYSPEYLGAAYAVYQSGTDVWFATFTEGAWSQQRLVDAGAPLADPPFLWSAPAGATVVFRTTAAAWKADRGGTAAALVTSRLGPIDAVPSAAAAYTNITSVVAVDDGDGSALYWGGSSTPIRTYPERITGLRADHPYVYARLAGGDMEILKVTEAYRRVQTLRAVAAFDTSAYQTFAADGTIQVVNWPSSIVGANDPAGDGVDRDCDGLD